MLSKDAATNFSKTRLAPTIVKGLVPGRRLRVDRSGVADEDARRRRQATSSTTSSSTTYGMNTDQLVVWNSFLSGQTDVAGLTRVCRASPTRSPTDSSIKKEKVTS